MSDASASQSRCGLDTVEIARMEKLLSITPPEQLSEIFSATELADAGAGAGRVESLAARFAAKEACCKLFPQETARGTIGPADFSIRRNNFGAPEIEMTANARAVLDRNFVSAIRVSLTHTATSASAMALAEPRQIPVPWYGKLLYRLFPYRREVVFSNMRRVFGDRLSDADLVRLAQAYNGHYVSSLLEMIKMPFLSQARRQRLVRAENTEIALKAHQQGKGLILLTGHFGNWEVSTVAGIQQFPEFKGRFHFVRRPLKPKLLNDFVTRRFKKAGFGTIAKRGSLDQILDLLARQEIVVFVFDQHAGKRDGVVVDFFGHPAGTFKSPVLIALASGAPVIPATSWREPDGTHVLRFENPIPMVETDDAAADIRTNTRACNAVLEQLLLRHPEQWIWMHRRWKIKAAEPATKTA